MNYLSGFTLIEIVVSLLLLSLILLGFDAAEVYSTRAIRAAYYFDIANIQLNNMIERLRAIENQDEAMQEVEIWNNENQSVLPQGRGVLDGIYPLYRVTLYWGSIAPPCQQSQLGTSGCLSQTITL